MMVFVANANSEFDRGTQNEKDSKRSRSDTD